MAEIIPCPVHTAVSVIGGKWKAGILFRLAERPHRFGELKRAMFWMAEKTLIRQLRQLESDGVITRTDHQTSPPHVDYELSPYGETLRPLLAEMGTWGAGHLARLQGEMTDGSEATS